jgi:hypothetical protein
MTGSPSTMIQWQSLDWGYNSGLVSLFKTPVSDGVTSLAFDTSPDLVLYP